MQNPDRIFRTPIGKRKIPIGFSEPRSGNAKSRSDFQNPDREMQNPDRIFRTPIGKCKIPTGFLEPRSIMFNAIGRTEFNEGPRRESGLFCKFLSNNPGAMDMTSSGRRNWKADAVRDGLNAIRRRTASRAVICLDVVWTRSWTLFVRNNSS
jgi:hypothetical protein